MRIRSKDNTYSVVFPRNSEFELVPFVEMTAGYSVTIKNLKDDNGNEDPSEDDVNTDNENEDLNGVDDPTDSDDN